MGDTPAYVMELVAVEMKTSTANLPMITPTGWYCPDAGVLGRNAVIRRARQRFDRNIRYFTSTHEGGGIYDGDTCSLTRVRIK